MEPRELCAPSLALSPSLSPSLRLSVAPSLPLSLSRALLFFRSLAFEHARARADTYARTQRQPPPSSPPSLAVPLSVPVSFSRALAVALSLSTRTHTRRCRALRRPTACCGRRHSLSRFCPPRMCAAAETRLLGAIAAPGGPGDCGGDVAAGGTLLCLPQSRATGLLAGAGELALA